MKYGEWIVKEDELVLKLGVCGDKNQFDCIEKFWQTVEMQAKQTIVPFSANTCFYEETTFNENQFFSFRYYTPEDNREKFNGS